MSASARLQALAATLLVASFGGLAAHALSLPVAWLLGSAIAVSLASLAGLRTDLPDRLRDAAFLLLGLQAGSGVTPAVAEQIVLWPLSFAIQMLGVVVTVLLSVVFLRGACRWDRDTALFASLPGALSFVLAAASETRADMSRVTVVQSVRLILLIGALTPTLAWLGGPEAGALPGGGAGALAGSDLAEHALLLGACVLAGIVGARLRIPGGLMLGALLASAALHASGVVDAALPPWLAAPLLVLLGALIGSRLRGIDRHVLARLLPASAGAFAIGLCASGAAALVALALLGIDFSTIALAYAPGAIEALTVLAFQFNLDPAFVAAHHVVRFLCIALLVPFLARRIAGGTPGA